MLTPDKIVFYDLSGHNFPREQSEGIQKQLSISYLQEIYKNDSQRILGFLNGITCYILTFDSLFI